MNDDILWKIDSEIGKDKKVVELKREIERKDYLLKEQGKELKDLYKEIERLNNQLDFIKDQNKYIDKLEKMVKERNSIIKEVREYIELGINFDSLGVARTKKELLKILDKVGETDDSKRDV